MARTGGLEKAAWPGDTIKCELTACQGCPVSGRQGPASAIVNRLGGGKSGRLTRALAWIGSISPIMLIAKCGVAEPVPFQEAGFVFGTGFGTGQCGSDDNSLQPLQRIWMPMQSRMKAESRTTTLVPLVPSRWTNRSAKR